MTGRSRSFATSTAGTLATPSGHVDLVPEPLLVGKNTAAEVGRFREMTAAGGTPTTTSSRGFQVADVPARHRLVGRSAPGQPPTGLPLASVTAQDYYEFAQLPAANTIPSQPSAQACS